MSFENLFPDAICPGQPFEPLRENSRWVPTDFSDMSTQQCRTSVHRYLRFAEDFQAKYDGQWWGSLTWWLEFNFNMASDEWQRLFAQAWNEHQDYTGAVDHPHYWRPSLWLLHGPWMEAHGHDAIADIDLDSTIFEVDNMSVEDMLVWQFTSG